MCQYSQMPLPGTLTPPLHTHFKLLFTISCYSPREANEMHGSDKINTGLGRNASFAPHPHPTQSKHEAYWQIMLFFVCLFFTKYRCTGKCLFCQQIHLTPCKTCSISTIFGTHFLFNFNTITPTGICLKIAKVCFYIDADDTSISLVTICFQCTGLASNWLPHWLFLCFATD